MDTVIGLGNAGCAVTRYLKKYPQYITYEIDTDVEGENCYKIKEESTPEDYERNTPDLGQFFKRISGNILFIVAGDESISGSSLQILKQIKNSKINVLYIRAAQSDLNRVSSLQERLVRNVFQEYARSGVFSSLYMISKDSLEEIIGDVPILEYNNKIYEYISSIVHWVNVFRNSHPVFDNYEDPKETARIGTFGILNIADGEEKNLYPLDKVIYKNYYYAINENTLKTDGKLLKNIREQVSQTGVMSSYEIHPTKYEKSFCYFVCLTNSVQPLDK